MANEQQTITARKKWKKESAASAAHNKLFTLRKLSTKQHLADDVEQRGEYLDVIRGLRKLK